MQTRREIKSLGETVHRELLDWLCDTMAAVFGPGWFRSRSSIDSAWVPTLPGCLCLGANGPSAAARLCLGANGPSAAARLLPER